jgi:chromate transporter
VALQSFGGPAGQIAVMHRILVEEKGWLSETRFLHALNYCMLLPGPEAMQLATYAGWLLHRAPGGLVAGTLFVLPGFLAIMALSCLYATCQDLRLVPALFYGLKAAVLAVVLEAVLRIGRRALRAPAHLIIAGLAFGAIFFFAVPFPWIVAAAALAGWLTRGAREPGTPTREPREPGPEPVRPSPRRTLYVLALGLSAWFGPLAAVLAFFGPQSVYFQVGVFFSKVAVVTFGGAYAVLAYVAQQAVEVYGWLRPGEMLDGLGMAETTPGPLIQVVGFVGFLGAYRQPGELPPLAAGVLAAAITTWVTYVPSFLWIFLGAPYIEALRGHRVLASALAGVTAAVVGVILNLAVWFSLHTLFARLHQVPGAMGARLLVPEWSTLDPWGLLLTLLALAAMLAWRWGMLATLGASVVLGLGLQGLMGRLSS